MSAESALRTALLAALGELDANGVWLERPARASPPWIELQPILAADWSTKTERGRELRVAVTIRDEGESPARLVDLLDAAGDAVEALAPDLGGWRIASLAFLRSRVTRDGEGWAGMAEYRVRVSEI